MFGTTGSPEQFENIMKELLICIKRKKKSWNAFGSALKMEKRFLQLSGRQSEVALSSGSNQQFNFLHRD